MKNHFVDALPVFLLVAYIFIALTLQYQSRHNIQEKVALEGKNNQGYKKNHEFNLVLWACTVHILLT